MIRYVNYSWDSEDWPLFVRSGQVSRSSEPGEAEYHIRKLNSLHPQKIFLVLRGSCTCFIFQLSLQDTQISTLKIMSSDNQHLNVGMFNIRPLKKLISGLRYGCLKIDFELQNSCARYIRGGITPYKTKAGINLQLFWDCWKHIFLLTSTLLNPSPLDRINVLLGINCWLDIRHLN